jgi:hypothetical protein
MAIPRSSLPPGRYTIVVRATSADGTQVVRRVYVTIKAKPAKKRKTVSPKAVAAPSVDGGGEPPAQAPQDPRPAGAEPDRPAVAPGTGALPTTTTQNPRKPLAAASNFVGGKHRRSLGLVMILLSMGSAVGFLIMVELQRMLPAPRRLA